MSGVVVDVVDRSAWRILSSTSAVVVPERWRKNMAAASSPAARRYL